MMSKSLLAAFSPHKFIPQIIAENINFDDLWNTNQALVFSNMAHIAYFNKEKVEVFLEQLNTTIFHFYNYAGAQAFLAIWHDKAILSFRGTQSIEFDNHKGPKLSFFDSLKLKFLYHLWLDSHSSALVYNDILANLKLKTTTFDSYEKVKVHSGFLQELNKLWPEIKKDIQQDVGNLPIWTTGHSLGGALSTLAAMRYPFEGVITFGEPRVGSQIELAFKAKNHIRYINGKDPVPSLPPEFIYNYKHHGEEKNISIKEGDADVLYDHSIVYYSKNLS